MPKEKYTVETVTKRATVGPAGRLEKMYEVAFITEAGVRDTVEIPEKEYTPERVKALVSEITEKHEQVMKG